MLWRGLLEVCTTDTVACRHAFYMHEAIAEVMKPWAHLRGRSLGEDYVECDSDAFHPQQALRWDAELSLLA